MSSKCLAAKRLRAIRCRARPDRLSRKRQATAWFTGSAGPRFARNSAPRGVGRVSEGLWGVQAEASRGDPAPGRSLRTCMKTAVCRVAGASARAWRGHLGLAFPRPLAAAALADKMSATRFHIRSQGCGFDLEAPEAYARICPVRDRMREIRTSGSLRSEGGNPSPARLVSRRVARASPRLRGGRLCLWRKTMGARTHATSAYSGGSDGPGTECRGPERLRRRRNAASGASGLFGSRFRGA
jgi:hypothetical protein